MRDPFFSDPGRCRRWLGGLLVISYALRVWLACRGGQMFWPDEARYVYSEVAAQNLLLGHWRIAAGQLLGQGQHTLFPLFCLVPGLIEAGVGLHLPLVAAYFGLFSVLAIGLIWAIARRAGAGEKEALWAAFLAACANSLFYYSRHLFPYDMSLCVMLGALWLALGPWSWRNSLLVGLVAGLGFLTYNGYWWLGGCVLILHALLGQGGHRRIWARAVGAGFALVAVLLLILGLSKALGHDLVGDDARDAQGASLVLGDFSSGLRVTAGYLWYAEGGLLIIWVAALGYACFRAWCDRAADRLAWYAGGVLLVPGGLLLLSDPVLFPVFGRRVREVVPFLCLGAATGIVQFIQRRSRGRRLWMGGIALLAAAVAAQNFSRPLRQVFPDEFLRLAAAAAAKQSNYQAYRLLFTQRTLLGRRLDLPVPPYPVILRRAHPLQYRPYQYEGYDAAQRADINRQDVSMRLIGLPERLEGGRARWNGYPGPVRLAVRFPANATGHFESLIATGRTGQGDIFYLHYADAGHVGFGLDHWGVSAVESAPVAVDYARPHEIILFAGFLLPPGEGPADGPDRAWYLQRDRLVVWLDGNPVFSMRQSFYPVPRSSISFGVNFIGGSLAGPEFTGEILEFGSAPSVSLPARPGPGAEAGKNGAR